MNWMPLLLAMSFVESGADVNAVNRSENAAGILQITLPVIIDVNQYFHTLWRPYHRWDRRKSYQIAVQYFIMYGAKTYEEAARIWNGGPNGPDKVSTLKYWIKIQWMMKQQESLIKSN